MSGRVQGSRQNILNTFYNQNAGNPSAWLYVPDSAGRRSTIGTWENYTPRITWQAIAATRSRSRGTSSLSAASARARPLSAARRPRHDLAGSGWPGRVQPAARADGHGGRRRSPTSCCSKPASAPPTTSGAATSTTRIRRSDLVRVTGLTHAGHARLVARDREVSLAELVRQQDRGSNWASTADYVTGSHSVKIGYQGNYWRDDREDVRQHHEHGVHVPRRGSELDHDVHEPLSGERARAMQDSLYVQDQWTVNRLTLQGALRYDHPWSWFPETTIPASRFFPGAHFQAADGVTGYNDITPRFGAAYDVFGNGKTALKVNIGKYLQGASVSNLAYGSNPSLRTPARDRDLWRHLRAVDDPHWTDANGNFIPDCVLENPLAQSPRRRAASTPADRTATRPSPARSSIGATFDPDLLSGWGKRPSDWSFGVSVQQEIFPRASVEVAYYRRWFTMFTTGGSVTDNLAIGPNDVDAFTLTAPTDPRLPGSGGQSDRSALQH